MRKRECDVQKEFRDIHKGKLAFLLGTGVSLDEIDENLLRPYVTMAIGDSLIKMSDPTYTWNTDGHIFKFQTFQLLTSDKTKILIDAPAIGTEGEESTEIETEGLFKGIHPNRVFAVKRKDVPDPERHIARDSDNRVVFGISAAQGGAHLLHIMGCDPIVLLGHDCRYYNGIYAFWMLPKYFPYKIPPQMLEICGDTPAQKWIEKFSKTHYSGDDDGMLSANRQDWEKTKFEPYSRIIDASLNGSLKVFPKMSFNEIMKQYGDRTL